MKTDNRTKDADSKSQFSTSKALQVPQLEEWFEKNSHPCHAVVASYTESLNSQPYRYKGMYLFTKLTVFSTFFKKGGGVQSKPMLKKKNKKIPERHFDIKLP